MSSHGAYGAEYARIYDVLMQHKDYRAETVALIKTLKRLNAGSRILSIGCGTGSHEILLATAGFQVLGIDESPFMIAEARRKSSSSLLQFGTSFAEARRLLGRNTDCALMLFNVVNCVRSMEDLYLLFTDVRRILSVGGVLFFEAWNGMQCIVDPPIVVERQYSDRRGQLHRTAIPKLEANTQSLSIQYQISGNLLGKPVSIESHHELRLFSVMEVQYLLRESGFTDVAIYSALPDVAPLDVGATTGHRMLAFSARASKG